MSATSQTAANICPSSSLPSALTPPSKTSPTLRTTILEICRTHTQQHLPLLMWYCPPNTFEVASGLLNQLLLSSSSVLWPHKDGSKALLQTATWQWVPFPLVSPMSWIELHITGARPSPNPVALTALPRFCIMQRVEYATPRFCSNGWMDGCSSFLHHLFKLGTSIRLYKR